MARCKESTNRQKFFVEAADLPRAIYKVDLQYPVALAARSIG